MLTCLNQGKKKNSFSLSKYPNFEPQYLEKLQSNSSKTWYRWKALLMLYKKVADICEVSTNPLEDMKDQSNASTITTLITA